MGTEILEALAESASAGIGISAAVMAIAKEIEPLVKTTVASSGSSGVGSDVLLSFGFLSDSFGFLGIRTGAPKHLKTGMRRETLLDAIRSRQEIGAPYAGL